MENLYQAHHQWANRPADQRFVSLVELDSYCQGVRENSRAKVISSKALQVQPASETDHFALAVAGPNGEPTAPTNWAFGQLAAKAGAPAGYMRGLPAPLAADCLNWNLSRRDIEDVGVLTYQNGGPPMLTAVTGPNYGRVWNCNITKALLNRFGDGLTGPFKVPGEFGKDVTVTKHNTTLYASDRDLFVFLANEKNKIEVPNRRNGNPGLLSRGFMTWNSEVGSQTYGIATFLFDYVCCNRIIWGAEQFAEIRIRHTASAPDKWINEVAPAIEAYSEIRDRQHHQGHRGCTV